MKEKIKVKTKAGKTILIYKDEATMLEKLGKLAGSVKERKTKNQTKELKAEPETKDTIEDPEKKPMSKERNLKNL